MRLSNHAGGFRARSVVAACALGAVAVLCAVPAPARGDENPIEAYARWVATSGRWAGPTAPFPDAAPRPAHAAWVLDSALRPLRVHGVRSVSDARAREVLRALEGAYDTLADGGWPLPFPDGGRGGSLGFDLYLVDGARGVRAEVDVPVPWAPLDAATSWAAIGAHLAPDVLDACVLAALTEAALLGQDPAEDPAWRRATGAFVAYLATGRFGCDDESVIDRQRAPHTGWAPGETDAGAGMALLLAMVSEREGGAPGAFVRELWQLVRQRSDGPRLRGSPHFGEALALALDNAGESLETILETVAVDRYFVGDRAGTAGAPYAVLRSLSREAAPPLAGVLRADPIPRRVTLEPPLDVGGSAYVRIAVGPEREGAILPLWLVGQSGARWSLVAVKLDANGGELGRVAAPPRRLPKSYLPIVLEPGTRTVLVTITALPRKPADFAFASDAQHHAHLIVGEREP